jgi:DNA-directed RNA polymerase
MGERFLVPLNIDFRGRVYPIPHFNFTRDDRVRGLFLFADGKPIGEDGLLWLKAHVAGRADGVSWSDHQIARLSELNFAERVAWTDANSDLLRKIGEAVLRGDDPAKWNWALPKDEPYQFLAACAELAQAWDNPEFTTRLPLTFDASCSGLQHLCAMTRDEEGGCYVNLTPNEAADDFYRRVAFEAFHAEPKPDRLTKDKTGVGGFNKGKAYGMTKQVIDAGAPTRHAKKLAHAICACIEDMLRRPKGVRDYLEGAAKLAAQQDKPLRWTTPLGLPVINIYQLPDIKNLSIRMNERKRSMKLTVGDKEGLAVQKAANAITANFVHSCDAAHMHLVALAAAKAGIEMVGVHDCFGTVAPDAGRLNEIIRDELINLHKRHNWLNELWASAKRDGVKLELFTDIGTLELEPVRASFHAYR